MKKRRICSVALLLLVVFLQGCSVVEEEEKLRALEYTVVSPDDIPEDLANEIQNVKDKEFQLSYDDGEYLYIAKGYGARNTSGYNVTVKEVYLTEHTLVFDTEITGPREGEDVADKKTMPFIVVKTETMDRQIIYK